MSTSTITKKRKSLDSSTPAVKKVKTAKSADAPAPLKSALKKPKDAAKAGKNGKETAKPKKSTTALEVVSNDTTADLTPDQTAALLAGFSSDEDEASDDEEGIAISSLPKAPTSATVRERIEQAISVEKKNKSGASDGERTPGVIYIGRIPHGFYEHQLRAYFSQFGDITNLRLMRNRKTGNSQHYGFIEFASAAVAEIVCKTMDKYLLFGHILQVKRVPNEQMNEQVWKRSSRRARNVAPRNRLEGTHLRKGATREVWEARVEREEKKRKDKAEKLRELGYEFEMPAVKGVGEVAVKPKMIEAEPEAVEADAEKEAADVAAEQTAPEEVVPVQTGKKRSAQGKTEVKKAIKKVKA